MSHCNQIKLQCLDCGQSVGNAIKHASIAADVLSTILEFDYEFRDSMREKKSEEFRQKQGDLIQEEEYRLEERREQYAAYLATPKWREKRAMVIDRENGLCQGCRQHRIQEVHHLTYKNCGDELLFQLVGLCSECHRRAHA